MSLVMSKITGELREEFFDEQDIRAWMIAGVLETDAKFREMEESGEISSSVRKEFYYIVPRQCLEAIWHNFAGNEEEAAEAQINCKNHLCWVCAGSRGVSDDYVESAFKDKNLFQKMLERARNRTLSETRKPKLVK